MADQDNIGSGQFVDTSADPDIQLQLTRLQRTRAGFLEAANQDPDVYAQARRLAQTTGQPIDSVLRNPKPARQAQAMNAVDWDSLETVAPTTAQMFRDMDKAKLVGRDLPEFSQTEAAWLSLKNSVDERLFRPVMRGAKAAQQQLLDLENFGASFKYKEGSWQQRRQQRQYAKDTSQINREIDSLSAPDSIQQGLKEIQSAETIGEALHAIWNNPAAVGDVTLESLASSAPSLAATIATGGYSRVATGTMAGSGSYLQEYSSTIKEVMQENGVDINDPKAIEAAYQDESLMTQAKAKAKLRGVAVGVMDGLSTAIAGFAVSGAKGTVTSKLSRSILETGTQAAAGGTGEGLAQAVTGEYQPGAILLEAAAEAPTAPFDIRANYKDAGLHIEAKTLAEKTVSAAAQAEKHKAQFDKLAEMAKADKVLQRAPELIEEMVQNATQDSGASHIYISANDLHQSGMAVDVAAVSPTVAAEIRQATVENGLIAIPAAEYATRIAPQQWATQFNEHIRETPDAYSAAESAKIIEENGAQLKGEFDAAMHQISESEAFSQSAGTVKESILGQLKQLGVHSDAVNDGYATVFSAYYATRAKQLGETPEALFARRPLNWQAQRQDGSGVIAEASDYTQGAQGQFTPTEKAMQRWRESLARTPAGSPTAKATLQTPTAIKAMGEKATHLEASVSMIAQVAKKHPDVPGSVFENLPALLADPLYVYSHKEGGLSVVLDATTAKGEPLVVGVRDGRIRTVTPSNDDGETGSGMARALQNYEAAKQRGEKVYTRNEETPVKTEASAGGAYRANSVGQVSTRRATVVRRSSLVKSYGEDFYQSAAPQEQQQFTETEQQLGGKPAYDKAKAEGKTKLNYRQWVQVRTPAFKAWFGDWENDPANASKVTDRDTGEPTVVYHGTDANFTAYDTSKTSRKNDERQNIWLTTDEHQAARFGANVLPLFAAIKNPAPRARKGIESDGFKMGDSAHVADGHQVWTAKESTQIKSATGNSGAFDGTDPNILYQSAHDTAAERNALRELSQMEALFAVPKSHATDVVQAVADIDETFVFEGKREDIDLDGRTAYDFKTADGEAFTIYTRDNEAGAMLPYGHYGYAQSDDYTGRPAFANRPGDDLEGASDGRSDVWIDVSQFKGAGNGAKVYAAAADFAHNTGGVFIGDPASLSDDAMRRRPIQMLAAAMRWGTTDHIAPHPRQFAGDNSIGVPALKWEKGDTIGNLRKLVDLSLKLEQDSPHGIDITYDPESGQFLDAEKLPIDRRGIATVAADLRGESTPSQAGQSGRSNARAAVLHALLRQEGEGGGGSNGRPAGLLERLSRSVRRDGTLARGEQNLRALFQNETAPLGSFNPETFTITLLKGANLSTALHEGAHFFFENDLFIAGQISAEAQAFGYDGLSEGEKQILADASALLKWHGLDGDIHEQLNRWHSLTREEIRAYHERTAESFERYLLEGKAPSLELQSYFSKFRAWMLSVYSSLKNLLANNPQAGELNPEVRSVFDRMLATNEEIALAQQARGMMAMFDDASSANMQPAEFSAYQALGKEATNSAIEQLQAKGIKDMAWLHRTKSKAIKRLGKEAAQLRAEYRHEAARQIMALPVYQAWQFLTRRISAEDKLGKPIDPNAPKSASINPAADTLLDAIAKLGGINEAEAKRLYGVSRKEFPLKDSNFGKPVIRKTGGLGVDALGEALAENGYLPTNEHGQFDSDDFEDRFMNALGGSPEYSVYYDWDAAEHRANARAGDQVPNPTALGAGRLDMGELQAWPDLSEADIAKLQAMRMTAKNGLHPDIVSDIVPGFGSGDEMLQAILQAKDPHAAIEELVDARMLMEHGELSTPEAIDKAADAAVFNETRLKFAAAEANALAKATGQRSVLLAAAKQFAAERIARSTIRNILPGQYAAASARAAKEAQAASKRGDTAGAAAQKRNEVMHSVATKAAYDALAEVDKAVAYFKRVLQSPSISHDAKAQIEALLGRYDLRTGQSLKAIDRKESLVAFVKRQIAEGNVPDIGVELLPQAERAAYFAATATLDADGNYIYADDAMRLELLAAMLEDSATTHYKNLTMEQLRGLRETVQQIEHLGRLKDRLLNAKDGRTLNQRKDDIANSIREHSRQGAQMQPTRDDLPSGVLRGIKRFASAHIRMAIKALVMDGGKDNGAMWEHFILPLNEAFDKETTMTADLTARLNAILTPVLKDVPIKERMGKGKYYKHLGANLNWSNRFAILLNMGNESNMQRLLSGGVGGQQNLTLGQVMPILSEFSAAELQAAQQVWDLFESLRPQIAELERLTKGREPEWIPARALTLRSKEGESVTLRGGYFPVVFDPQMSIKESENKEVEAADATKRAARATNTTRQSFTKQRVEEVKGMPLLLTLDGLYRGLSDVVHDLSFRTAAIDTSRLLRSKRITDAIAEHYGMDRVKELREFVQDMVAGQNASINAGAKILQLARQNVAMAGLGLNIMNWLQQPLGISNSIIRLGGGKEGAKWLGRGLVHYFNNPRKATSEAQDKSAFMQDRARTRFRELNEIRNTINGSPVKAEATRLMMSGMIWMQQIADTITWHAAVEKATASDPTMPEERIYAIANQVVRDSQGSGHEVDLARIERGDEVQKIFTVFFNFMNTGNNLAYLSANSGRGKVTVTTDMLLAFVFPVITAAMFKAMTPGGDSEDKDPEELMLSLGKGVGSYLLSGVFFFREFGAMLDGYGYRGPGGLRLIGDAYAFGQQVRQGEMDDAFRKAALNLAGSAFGVPSAQVNRTWTGMQALADGDTDNPAALVFGFQKQ